MVSLSDAQSRLRASGQAGRAAGYDNLAVLGFDHLAEGLDMLHSLLSQIVDDPNLSLPEVLALSAAVVEAAEGVERIRVAYLQLRDSPPLPDAH